MDSKATRAAVKTISGDSSDIVRALSVLVGREDKKESILISNLLSRRDRTVLPYITIINNIYFQYIVPTGSYSPPISNPMTNMRTKKEPFLDIFCPTYNS